MEGFEKPKLTETKTKKRDIPSGLWVKCKGCGEMMYAKELAANLKVCLKCGYHFSMSAKERIASLADDDTFVEFDADLVSVDVLKFTGVSAYTDRLKTYQRQTGLNDAVVSGTAKLNGHDVVLAAMDFGFLGASMGSVVGEKITRSIEKATELKVPVIIISTSGARGCTRGF